VVTADAELDYSHGRIIRRSLWATTAEGIDFPHVTRAARIRRDGYDLDDTLISKEIVHAVTSLDAKRASAADLAKIARGQWGIECAERTPVIGVHDEGYSGGCIEVQGDYG
jgi:hypothetical protein